MGYSLPTHGENPASYRQDDVNVEADELGRDYGLSYKKFAKQHSQLFIAAFAVTLSICVYISVVLLNMKGRYDAAEC
jgi:hypothetical protein